MAHTVDLGGGGGRLTAGGNYRLWEVGPARVVWCDPGTGCFGRAAWGENMPLEVEREAEKVMAWSGYGRLSAGISGYHDGQYRWPCIHGWQHDDTGRVWVSLHWGDRDGGTRAAKAREFADVSAAERWLASEGVRLGAQGLYA